MKIKNGKDYKTIEKIDGLYGVYGTGGLISHTDHYLISKPTVCIGRKGTIDKPMYFDQPIWTVDTLFYSDIFTGYFPLFIYYLFLTVKWQNYNQSTGVPSLTSSAIEQIRIYVPNSKKEQEKIASPLFCLDKKIETITSKIQALKKYKEGLINLCFSFGHKSKISSFVTQLDLRNKSNEKLTVFSISNKKGFIPQEEQFEGNEIASPDKSNYKVVKKGDFAYNPARINVGSIGFLSEEIGQVSPMYVVFSTHGIGNILLNEYFHSKFFRKELRKHLEGSVRQTLSFSNIGNFAIQVPDQKEKFDVLFSTINHKLDTLEKTLQIILKAKRYLLDNLFL